MASDSESPNPQKAFHGHGKEGATAINLPRYRMSDAGFDKFAILSGPIAGLLFFLFLPASLLLPPISPSVAPDALVTHYRKNEAGMRGGIALILFSGVLWPFFAAGISRQLARIPGINPTVVWAQLCSGAIGGVMIILPAWFFASAIYRLDRDPVLTQLMSDLAWFSISMAVPPFITQDLAISYGILSDRRPEPLLPHWVAWVNTGLVLGYLPVFGVHCVYRGVLAWNGALNFWVVLVCFGGVVFLQVIYFLKAVGKADEDCGMTERSESHVI